MILARVFHGWAAVGVMAALAAMWCSMAWVAWRLVMDWVWQGLEEVFRKAMADRGVEGHEIDWAWKRLRRCGLRRLLLDREGVWDEVADP